MILQKIPTSSDSQLRFQAMQSIMSKARNIITSCCNISSAALWCNKMFINETKISKRIIWHWRAGQKSFSVSKILSWLEIVKWQMGEKPARLIFILILYWIITMKTKQASFFVLLSRKSFLQKKNGETHIRNWATHFHERKTLLFGCFPNVLSYSLHKLTCKMQKF